MSSSKPSAGIKRKGSTIDQHNALARARTAPAAPNTYKKQKIDPTIIKDVTLHTTKTLSIKLTLFTNKASHLKSFTHILNTILPNPDSNAIVRCSKGFGAEALEYWWRVPEEAWHIARMNIYKIANHAYISKSYFAQVFDGHFIMEIRPCGEAINPDDLMEFFEAYEIIGVGTVAPEGGSRTPTYLAAFKNMDPVLNAHNTPSIETHQRQLFTAKVFVASFYTPGFTRLAVQGYPTNLKTSVLNEAVNARLEEMSTDQAAIKFWIHPKHGANDKLQMNTMWICIANEVVREFKDGAKAGSFFHGTKMQIIEKQLPVQITQHTQPLNHQQPSASQQPTASQSNTSTPHQTAAQRSTST